jgi:hypothetical protein
LDAACGAVHVLIATSLLRLDVAHDDASIDTVRGYRGRHAASLVWCAEHAVNARTASAEDVKHYREDLVAKAASQ